VKQIRSFPCQPASVTAARRFVREALSDQELDTVESAELLTSELVTNCVQHARSGFELEVAAHGEVRIEVRDSGEGRPRMRSPALRDPSGRGLQIVAALAGAWGVRPTGQGKAVWFTLPARAPDRVR
jgi:anti-sigma regulatory factor (Ser/Thr protein kinase)